MNIVKRAISVLAILFLLFVPTNLYCANAEENCPNTNIHMTVDNPIGSFSGLTKVIGDTAYISFYGTITENECTYIWKDYVMFTNIYDVKKVEIHINSRGGSAFAGISIANIIETFQNEGVVVEVFATGVVGSAAIPIFAACSYRMASKHCLFMVHKSKLFKYNTRETIEDLDSQGSMMKMIRESYLQILADYTQLSKKDWMNKINETCWFTAKQALKWGLVDEIR